MTDIDRQLLMDKEAEYFRKKATKIMKPRKEALTQQERREMVEKLQHSKFCKILINYDDELADGTTVTLNGYWIDSPNADFFVDFDGNHWGDKEKSKDTHRFLDDELRTVYHREMELDLI